MGNKNKKINERNKLKIFLDEKGRYYCLKLNDKDEIHTNKGFFKYEKGKRSFVTNKNFLFFEVFSFKDYFNFIERGPQTAHIKDLGVIFAKILPQQDWIMVEAGTGSGQTTCFFAKYVKEIHSFEIRKEFFEIAKRNISFLGLENVYLYNENLENCNIKADFIFLDLGEPWKYLPKINEILKEGGFLVVYFTTPRQLDLFMDKLQKNFKNLVIEEIFEVIKRDWELKKTKEFIFCKPKSLMLGFTSIVTIIRKIKKE